jgi:hypothetical protein
MPSLRSINLSGMSKAIKRIKRMLNNGAGEEVEEVELSQ